MVVTVKISIREAKEKKREHSLSQCFFSVMIKHTNPGPDFLLPLSKMGNLA